MKKTFTITVDTASKEFKEAYVKTCKIIDPSLGGFYLFDFTVRELVSNRLEKFLENKDKDYGELLLPLTLGNLPEILAHMAD